MYDDLNFFNNENSVFENINYTKTEIGKKQYINILQNYTSDIAILKNRQTIIKDILKINSQEILNYIENIKIIEKDIYWLFEKKDKNFIELIDEIYFKYEWLNHGWIMSLNCNYKMYISVFISVISPLINVLIPYIILKYYGFKIKFFEYIKITRQSYNILAQLTGGNNSNIIRYITNTLMIFSYFSNVNSTYENSKKYHKIVNLIREKISNIDLLLNNTIKIKNLDKFSGININNQIEELKKIIGVNIIKNKRIFLYLYKNIKNYKELIFKILDYVGNIDMYISISKLLNNNYNFVIFSNLNYPYYSSKKLFHPSLKNKNIKNDIEIINNSLITGPNQSGKTIFLKSIVTSIILSQTIGISSSEKCLLTPFKYINTFINKYDNLGKTSLFEEGVNRCINILNEIGKLKNSEYAFVVMDEIFTTTNIQEGLSISISFCNEISLNKNNLFFISTHFKYLTKIKTFDKYKTLIDYDKLKNPIFTYKIVKGISEDKIAIKLLSNKMDNNIINNALMINNKLYNKLNKY
jgi:DNA mismatch repair ATPase MutS